VNYECGYFSHVTTHTYAYKLLTHYAI